MRYLQAMSVALVLALTFWSATLMPTHGLAQSAEPTCPGWESKVRLGTEPVQINPGGKCAMRLILVGERDRQELCVFIRVAGSRQEHGPFCTSGPRFGMPEPIEWLWSAGTPMWAKIKLCDAHLDPSCTNEAWAYPGTTARQRK